VLRFTSERLEPSHDLGRFVSGAESLDGWLRDHAFHAQRMRTAQTFVWREGDDSRVVAYFSLAAHLIVRSELPRRVGRGSPDAIPAILLARLALDRSLQGEGYGGELLWDALTRACAAAEIAAARVVVVDAIDAGAAAFYAHHGFVSLPTVPDRLVQKVSDIAAALAG
jgi:GNAT superfamily N-acetyltransferase